MKKMLCLVLTVSLILGLNVSVMGTTVKSSKTAADLLKGVQHLKQSTIKIEGEKTIYVDPIMIKDEPKDGDIVFITHAHGDHYSPEDIRKVMKKGASLVVTEDVAELAKKDGFNPSKTVVPDKEYSVDGIKFTTVPAYNLNSSFHPKKNSWVGYIININNANYYMAGDTDFIPEMNKIKADVAFLPVGGTYTMNAEEAIKAANAIRPTVAVPIHFGDIVGTTDDAQAFVNGLDSGIEGVVLKDLLSGVQHFKQSTLRFQNDKVVYFDPVMIDGEPKDADYIFITHTHGDHFSIPDIKKVMKSDTVLIVTQDAVEAIVKEGIKNVLTVLPNKSYEVNGLKFRTVPAYNTNKDFHKKDNNWVGYIVAINNTNYYIAGDTDIIPEMKDIKANVIFLPVGGTYTMTANEAAQAANQLKPLIAVPIHFADIVGTWEDAKSFITLLNKGIKGVIIKKY